MLNTYCAGQARAQTCRAHFCDLNAVRFGVPIRYLAESASSND